MQQDLTNTTFQARAKAKINLFLHLIARESTGYHSLESIAAFAEDLYDTVSIQPSSKLSLNITGTFAQKLSSDDNIILKAAGALQNYTKTNYGAQINIVKNIPTSAGLGGGSADAAITLKLLSQLWNITLTPNEILTLCTELGSDVAICYHGKGAYFLGTGNIILPIDSLPSIYALIVNPLIPLSTKDVFTNRPNSEFSKPLINKPIVFNNVTMFINFLNEQKNDLFISSIKFVPEIKEIISFIKLQKNCKLARMSGSGATCFGLFTSLLDASRAFDNISNYNNHWWKTITILK